LEMIVSETNKEILCTLGPASLDERTIMRLTDLGATLFRINLSHTAINEVAPTVGLIQKFTDVPVCLDTEGAQIRTGKFVQGQVELNEHTVVRLSVSQVPGDAYRFNLYPRDIVRDLQIGDFISIDFASALVQVIDFEDAAGDYCAVARVLHGGPVGSNKAVTVDRDIVLPPLTDKDIAAISEGRAVGVEHFALSFANRISDVKAIRKVAGGGTTIISKIETLDALANLKEIADESDALLIDRGDLSRQVPIERIPALQKSIISTAKGMGAKIYVATNLLESMVTAPTPTRAEVNDIYNTLSDGADGLVLAAETAIGEFPVHCMGMVVKVTQNFEQGNDADQILPFAEPVSLLPDPHGGTLKTRDFVEHGDFDASELVKVEIRDTDLLDCEQLASGTFSPLSGFMDRETLESVLDNCSLPNGAVWTLPIILQVAPDVAQGLGKDRKVQLVDSSGVPRALLDIAEVSEIDLGDIALRWFGTSSTEHPGVAKFLDKGNYILAGDIQLIDPMPSPFRHYLLSPTQTRFLFAHKGWSRVVGFHTRNVAHRVHQFIQTESLTRTGADGLFISPVIGPKKPNDFLPGPIMKSYQLLLEFGRYEAGRVMLGGFATYSRYCGPREAVFTALCRKNMGCSHFIVGRDHTGVGDFYGPDENRAIFDRLGDIGIAPVFFEAIGFDETKQSYVLQNDEAATRPISGTEARQSLISGERLPDWYMEDIVQDMLLEQISDDKPVFYS